MTFLELTRGRVFALGAAVLCLAVLAGTAGWLAVRPDRPADFGSRPAAGAAGPSESAVPAAPAEPTEPTATPARPAPAAPPAPAPPRATAPAAGVPVRVLIPALGVRAAVDPMGVAADGAMALPPANRVGWYRFGPAPGAAAGSAVLAGHVDSRTLGLGVFSALRRARPGQRVTVVDATGREHGFRIVARQTIRKRALPVAELFRRGGPPVLTLVTCVGPYDRDRGGYQENLVLTATGTRRR